MEGVEDHDGTIRTDDGTRIPRLEMTVSHIINHTTVLYGLTETGKSVFIKDMMNKLHGQIDQALVFSPTEPANQAYKGYVHPTYIHTKVGPGVTKGDMVDFLKRLKQRQEMMMAMHNKASNLDTLGRLYNRIPAASRVGGSHLARLTDVSRAICRQIERRHSRNLVARESDIKKVKDRIAEIRVIVLKFAIRRHRKTLMTNADQMQLDASERYALTYLELNPRILLIFDDCSAELKPLFNTSIFREIFYQGRHSMMTVFVTCQDDTDMPAALRRNAFISVFTEQMTATTMMGRVKSKALRTTVEKIVPVIFDRALAHKHRKYVYIREDPTQRLHYHYTAKLQLPKIFGSPAVLELGRQLHASEDVIDETNPYFQAFRLAPADE